MTARRHLFLLLLLIPVPLSLGAQPQGYAAFEDSAVWKPVTKLPARKGEGAPDLVVTDVMSSRTMRLSDFKGQIVYLDFWATWCPSCLPLMSKFDELARKREADWKGKVALVGMSLDQEPKIVRRTTEGNGWKHVRQLWTPLDLSQREPVASKAFGIVELPYAVLIDASGTVIWRGNPLQHAPEEQIDRLLGSRSAPAAGK